MSHLNLRIKFNQIINEWKITSNEQFNFNKYIDYLTNKLSSKKDNICQLSFSSYSKTIDELINQIFVLKYIESNYTKFDVSINSDIANNLKENGYEIPKEHRIFDGLKSDKEFILHIYKPDNSTGKNKRIHRMHYCLMDKKYTKLNQEYYYNNLATFINSIDKYSFMDSSISVKKQFGYNDHLFATLSLDVYDYELCENGVNWIFRTSWIHLYPDILKIIRSYCHENGIEYHFPYNISIKWINDVLKNINFQIISLFYKLQQEFVNIRIALSENNSTNDDYEKICVKFNNKYTKINDLLVQKISLIEQLIYLNNLPLTNNFEDD